MVSRMTSASANIFGFKFGTDRFFSRSTKYRAFAMERLETQTTTFDSRALCTEFEARLQRFYDHELQDAFLRALNMLPNTFDRESEEHRALFGGFLNEYGTHYINYVVLGAKQVYSLEMKSLDVLSLRQMSVQVSETTSSKTMFGFARSAQVTAGGMIPGTPINVSVNTEISAEGEVSTTEMMTETISEEEERLNMIRAKTQRVVETNVGGTPPADGQWQTWAATAKDRPMPIVYELSELTEFMTEEVAAAYADYIEYYLEAGGTDDRNIEDALHYGVAQPKGMPISSYTLDPTSGQRTLTEYLEAQLDSSEDVPDENRFHRYNFLWDGSEVHESAVFLTLIRDNISPNFDEDTREIEVYNSDRYPSGIQIPFGLRILPGQATAAIFGVTDPKNLNSFSYLAADNLPANTTYKAGVIHPQGYPINKVHGTDIGFEISQDNDREFIVTFTTPFVETPTFLAFPLWFPLDGTYPTQFTDVSLAARSCNTTVCRLQVGARLEPEIVDSVAEDQYLGFSFVAIDGSQRNITGLVHGTFRHDDGIEPDFGSKGYRASFYQGEDIGVLIEFEQKFQDIPSVIVTPHIKEEVLAGSILPTTWWELFSVVGQPELPPETQLVYTLPSVYIEHITTSQVLIRARLAEVVGMEGTLTSIDFSFVAAGPMA